MANRRRSWAISGEEDVLSRLRTLQMSSGLGESAIRNRNNNNKNIRTEDDSNCTRWRAKLTPLVVASYSKSIASIKRWNGHFLGSCTRRTQHHVKNAVAPNFSVAASAIPGRVPLGFVCGYPVGIGGELYGGSMFMKSAANDTHQGKAIQAINEKWGEGRWCGRETIGIQVCKKKYAPFNFTVETNDSDGRKIVKVVRMFGCPHHSAIRKERIEKFGERKGWEPFGQWSLRKAQELARRETNKLNGVGIHAVTSDEESSSASATSDEEIRTICHNGKCAWRMREKYDNVCHEIRGIADEER